jgi:hypothetical protein
LLHEAKLGDLPLEPHLWIGASVLTLVPKALNTIQVGD